MQDRDGWIWFDAEWVPWREATTHVLTHSLHYGLAVFEGLRAYAGPRGSSIFRLREHTRRFMDSARAYRMQLPYSADTLEAAQLEVVRRNGLASCYVRPLAFLGSGKLGIAPQGAGVRVAIAAWSWDRYLDAAERGLRVKTSSFTRPPVNSLLARAKVSANYANSILAHLEAQEDGYDEALILDTEGYVAEGSGENLFLVRDGKLYEPAPTSALLGITRDSVRTLADELGYEVCERRLTRDDVYLADEAFFCGTAIEVAPIVELDRRRIGSGSPGPVTRALRAAYDALVHGRNERHLGWLTPLAASG